MTGYLLIISKFHTVDTFRLHSMEKRFHEGIVGHLTAGTVHTLDKTDFRQTIPKDEGAVLGATIRVKDGARLWIAIFGRLVEGTQGEGRVLALAQAKAYYSPGKLVHYRGKVTPLATYLQVGDVTHPYLICSNRYNIQAIVGNAGKILLQTFFAAINPGTAGFDASAAH